jgi:hypothetical protein
MERIVNRIFESTMFSDIIFVDENPCTIEKVYKWKKNGKIATSKVEMNFKMSNARSKEEDSLIKELVHSFVVRLNFNWARNEFRYFKRNLISRLLGKRDPNEIAEMLAPYDWCIAGKRIVKEMSKLESFVPLEGETEIRAVGSLKGAVVYQLPDEYEEDSMYLGCSDSMSLVFSTESCGLGWMYEYHISGKKGETSRHTDIEMKKIYFK